MASQSAANGGLFGKLFWPLYWFFGKCMEGLLFVFDNNSNVERIIENQPWSFDKHLVVLQTFEEFSKLKDLVFDKALFRVQVHDIAESIWETIGEV